MAEGAHDILIVEDDVALREVLTDELSARGHRVRGASTVAEGLEETDKREYHVVVQDLQLSDGSGIDILKRVRDAGLSTEVVILTGYAEVATAIEAMKLGAYDYLSKPASMTELEVVVAKAAEKALLRRQNAALRAGLAAPSAVFGIVTRNVRMRELLETAGRAAASQLPILVLGESGTGKELVARAVHRHSPRADLPFIAINCAAVTETLVESELFGHERGAFTGATKQKPGLFEAADGGVLFLDEIGDVSLAVQAKLLRVLENNEFMRVGGTRTIHTDVRIVSATHKNLLAEIESGSFREDLYYRLNGVTLAIPPLRDRKDDIPLLTRHFLGQSGKLLSRSAVAALLDYDWPGNVRELEMVVRRASALCDGEEIGSDDLLLQARPRVATRPSRTDLTLAEMEAEYIEAVLAKNGGHRGNTAKALGIDPKTLYNKLRR